MEKYRHEQWALKKQIFTLPERTILSFLSLVDNFDVNFSYGVGLVDSLKSD